MINNMNFFLIFFERNIFKYEKNKKKLAQFLIFYAYMYRHANANIYIILILLRTSEIFFSIYTRAFSNKFNHYFIFAICKIKYRFLAKRAESRINRKTKNQLKKELLSFLNYNRMRECAQTYICIYSYTYACDHDIIMFCPPPLLKFYFYFYLIYNRKFCFNTQRNCTLFSLEYGNSVYIKLLFSSFLFCA